MTDRTGGAGNGDPYEAGMQARREVLGAEHVDRAAHEASPFGAEWQEFITRHAWGAAWTRPGLDRRTRSALTLALLTALHCHNEIPMHVRAALGNGMTVDEIAEVIMHTAVYAGVPAGNAAMQIAEATLRDLGEL